jgi:hypothetical protein
MILKITTQTHNYGPSSKKSLAVDIVRSSSKIKAIENSYKKPNKIIRKLIFN